ncbi:MAG: ribosome silencing factor [Flavobacteriales bacterium]|jgi:ribosome-associated protein|nr:ribosome silencing factor [Flavobacteriales bacterium]
MNKQTEKYTKQLVDTIIEGMQDIKALNIKCIDLSEIPNSVADYFIVCHGESNTQVDSIAKSVEKATYEQLKEKPLHKEGSDNSLWILLDYIDVMVHVFYKETRDYFDIEGLWADAKVTTIED